jgi:hypothetical protein
MYKLTKDDRVVLYNKVFGTDEGKIVLENLMEICGVNTVLKSLPCAFKSLYPFTISSTPLHLLVSISPIVSALTSPYHVPCAPSSFDSDISPDGSNADEMNEFYDKLGRPETPDDYDFDIGAHDQEGSYNAFRESAHKHGLTDAQAERYRLLYLHLHPRTMCLVHHHHLTLTFCISFLFKIVLIFIPTALAPSL